MKSFFLLLLRLSAPFWGRETNGASFHPPRQIRNASVRELQADTEDVQVLADLGALWTVQLVDRDDLILELQLHIAIEIPVDADRENPLVAAEDRALPGREVIEGVEIGVAVSRREFPSMSRPPARTDDPAPAP